MFSSQRGLVLSTVVGAFLALSGPSHGPRADRSSVNPVLPEATGPGPFSHPASNRGNGMANVMRFGAVGDGNHDDTTAVRGAIESLSDTGGVVFFPVGRYRIDGKLVLPNDGQASNPRQPPYTFQGAGALFDGRGGTPTDGTILDLRYFSGAKIQTFGLGLLEIEGLTLADFGFDDQPFIYTTNTTLHVHDCGFFGAHEGAAAGNDAIILGGTVAEEGTLNPAAGFQGYGTVIRDNYFGRIRRMVYGRVFANAVVVQGNTAWGNCGTSLPDGAAIELDGDPEDATPQVNGGWYVVGNLIEATFYPYGIKTRNSERNVFIGNNFFDPGAATQAYYRFDPSGKLNYVVAGFHEDQLPLVEDLAVGLDRSTIVDFHQSRESRYAQPVRFANELYLEPVSNSTAPFGPRLLNAAGTELTYQLSGGNGMTLWYTPAGGDAVPLWQVADAGDGTITQELKGTAARIRNLNGSISLQSEAGSAVEVGDASGLGIRISAGAVELTSTSAQILSGTGAPAASAPNGSMYLRTDGAAGSTLYVRVAGVWVAK